jgi:hypothetical protein
MSLIFGIKSFWILFGLAIFFYVMIPEWDKEENEFKKDIKEGNDLKKWYVKFPYRAPHHQGKQDLQKWLNKAEQTLKNL